MDTSNEAAVVLVNAIRRQLSGFVRSILNAGSDFNLSPMEGIQLGMQGLAVASQIVGLLHGTDAATRMQILNVLEHGELHMPS